MHPALGWLCITSKSGFFIQWDVVHWLFLNIPSASHVDYVALCNRSYVSQVNLMCLWDSNWLRNYILRSMFLLFWFTSQLILDIIGADSRFQGSLICPSCGQLCFVCVVLIILQYHQYQQSKIIMWSCIYRWLFCYTFVLWHESWHFVACFCRANLSCTSFGSTFWRIDGEQSRKCQISCTMNVW